MVQLIKSVGSPPLRSSPAWMQSGP